MNRDDFAKLVGATSGKSEYLPVAFLLCNGYACAGYYHVAVNTDLMSTCVLLNARLIELQHENKTGTQTSINDFNDFLQDVVAEFCKSDSQLDFSSRADNYGKTIPLTAIPYEQIAVVYPVAHIGALMRRAEQQQQERQRQEEQEQEQRQQSRWPTFLDLDRSEVIQLLRTKLW